MIILKNEQLEVAIDPDRGMTVESFRFRNREFLRWEAERKKAGLTYGIPFLFPTPSKVEDNVYHFRARKLPAVMHGFLRNESFRVSSQSPFQVTAVAAFDGSFPLFPYQAELQVKLTVEKECLSWDISLTNLDNEPLSYGLGLHPYFLKEPGMEVKTSFFASMPSDEHLIPSGQINAVDGTPLDFRSFGSVDGLIIDMVFLSEGPFQSTLRYQDAELRLSASNDFSHGIIYTDTEKEYLCVEPLTCSTDAHNLAEKGYQTVSGLIVLEAGETRESWVRLSARTT